MADIIEAPRELSALLNSNTYQGMTDDEIERVITYKENLAARNAVIEAGRELHAQQMEELKKQQRQACEAAMQALENALDTMNSYKQVNADE